MVSKWLSRQLVLLLVTAVAMSQHLRNNANHHRNTHGHRGGHHQHPRSATNTMKLEEVDSRSSYYQQMPDCTDPNITQHFIHKRTTQKAIICPMIKDEVGFLSEYVAFYEMMGFDHVIFYDDNSTTPLYELQPWIETGFVEIIGSWYDVKEHKLFRNPAKKFWDMMKVKFLAEIDCKRRALANGYDIFVSVDLDEYVFPRDNAMVTVVDALSEWFNVTTRGVLQIDKLNFNPSPHFLEPVNLLTIEAYLNRMKEPGKMNYYTSVAKKVALQLQGGSTYTNLTSQFLVHCCDFHGCSNYEFKICKELFDKGEKWNVEGKHKKWVDSGVHMHHYARSLEKYAMKQRSWETAGGARGYDLFNFFDRVLGFTYDNSALVYSCQVRAILAQRTQQQYYIRPGDSWYRNPEFGKIVEDSNKRGRNGAGYKKRLGPNEMNPYPPGDTYQGAHKSYQE